MSDVNEKTAVALTEMKTCRKAFIELSAANGPHTGVNRESSHLLKLIDEMAGLLTGDEWYLHDPHHSTPMPDLSS